MKSSSNMSTSANGPHLHQPPCQLHPVNLIYHMRVLTSTAHRGRRDKTNNRDARPSPQAANGTRQIKVINNTIWSELSH